MRTVVMADWHVTKKQKRLVRKVLESGRLTYGNMTRELEKQFAEIHGAKHALFTASGTDALKISLHALKDKYNWNDGDEVIVPAVTFVATVNAVVMAGLKPVLVDVERRSGNIDPKKVQAAINEKTRAIMPVHLLGRPAKIQTIMRIAKQYNLRVVEDSCETMFVNKLQGDMACFSTYLAHLLVTGLGGFILTNSDEMATVMRSMMFHGRDESYLNIDDKPADISKRFYFPRFGYSDRMTELEAALGLGDLDNWKKMIKKRQFNAKYLMEGLRDYVEFPISKTWNHAFMFFPVYAKVRDGLMVYLEKVGIQTRTMMPLTTQPVMKPYVKGHYINAEYINEYGLLLPCHQYLQRDDLDYMIESIREFYK